MSRQINLASRPSGWPTPDDFDLVEADLPAPQEGQVLVRNLFMSVDPYMRGRMNDAESYVPPFRLGEPLEGGAVGEVVESRAPGLEAGDLVLHGFGWREQVVADAARVRKVDPIEGVSPSAYLGVLGMPALTAYVGLLDIASFTEGDAVFVSGAAGAVGALVGQIARLKGASRVVGSAGSDAKVARLRELGFDAAFNYRNGPVAEQLREAAPDGIDVYFDNVGADHLEAAIERLRNGGRIAMCGAIAAYNATEPPCAPRNLFLAVGKRLTMRGFIVGDHSSRMRDMIAEVGGWLREGRIVADETVVDGLENAPAAFIGLLRGENTGKMIVRL
ncbi:NADP-dependent oxidoreductase [Planomonospora sp. ID82291]|uniref:NADP-dependent oxidoreductase n=1 Tax=Planomonospora sp. ID82291 TaxID=2738136 RepID=UPI0018C415C2|nr:NADP-dependent oxidoreductase [Planomonospora sp. ID82291]MBG0814140.1 NADP-dependent oxidoreductase [Planomonospora sp. ID82291]